MNRNNNMDTSQLETKNNEIIPVWNSISQKNMSKLFKEPTKFNQTINVWDVSNITNMEKMFNKKNKNKNK